MMKICLIQEYGDTRPNVSHYPILRMAILAIENGEIGHDWNFVSLSPARDGSKREEITAAEFEQWIS